MLPYFSIGNFTIYSYPLILGIIWGIAFHFSKKLLDIKKMEFPQFGLFYTLMFLSAWLGAKLFFLITLDQKYIDRAIDSANFWLGGGFVFYGGLVFGTITALIYVKLNHISLSKLNFVFPVLTLGHALGRVGCFLAGCCYGSHCDLPWAVFIHGENRHPVQLYEASLLFLLTFYLYRKYLEGKSLILRYFVAYAVIRFILEYFRGDEIRGNLALLSTSQWVSILIILISFVALSYNSLKKRN